MDDEADGDDGTAGQRCQRWAQPAGGEGGGVQATGDLAQVVEHPAELGGDAVEVGSEFVGAGRYGCVYGAATSSPARSATAAAPRSLCVPARTPTASSCGAATPAPACRGQAECPFAPFQRLGDRDAGGFGPGLRVARGLTRAMGGALTAEDTPGGGPTVVINLPAAPHAPALDPVEVAPGLPSRWSTTTRNCCGLCGSLRRPDDGPLGEMAAGGSAAHRSWTRPSADCICAEHHPSSPKGMPGRVPSLRAANSDTR
jgi:hypothetical protein